MPYTCTSLAGIEAVLIIEILAKYVLYLSMFYCCPSWGNCPEGILRGIVRGKCPFPSSRSVACPNTNMLTSPTTSATMASY